VNCTLVTLKFACANVLTGVAEELPTPVVTVAPVFASKPLARPVNTIPLFTGIPARKRYVNTCVPPPAKVAELGKTPTAVKLTVNGVHASA
jgi:hypothetical protein